MTQPANLHRSQHLPHYKRFQCPMPTENRITPADLTIITLHIQCWNKNDSQVTECTQKTSYPLTGRGLHLGRDILPLILKVLITSSDITSIAINTNTKTSKKFFQTTSRPSSAQQQTQLSMAIGPG